MPINGPSSYPATTDQFLKHWTDANAKLGAGKAIVLTGNISVADLQTKRDLLGTKRDAVTDAGLDRALAREALTTLVTRLQGKLVEFNGRVRADLPGSTFARVLPGAFAVGAAESAVREALRQMRTLWVKINAVSPAPAGVVLPMVLLDGTTAAQAEADAEALRVAYRALSDAEQALKLAREERNDVQDVIYEILKSYRLKVPTAVPADDALLQTLPALTPAAGHTPAAVKATGAWDAASAEAKVTWTASTEAELSHYEVRGVAGESYNTDDETVLATIDAGVPRELRTDFALSAPGLTAGFKVYVVLKTGNEKGSDAVYVKRPAA